MVRRSLKVLSDVHGKTQNRGGRNQVLVGLVLMVVLWILPILTNLQQTDYYITTALCSTRACLLTGRNHHSLGMAGITEIAIGFPGYNGIMPKEKTTIGATLRKYGHNTFAVGKWHTTLDRSICPIFSRTSTGFCGSCEFAHLVMNCSTRSSSTSPNCLI